MTTQFPTALDALVNPTAANNLSSPSHSGQHADINDAVEALQAKVGVNSSAVVTSLDYKIPATGTAELDFGSGNKTAVVVVTGVASALTTSRVMASMRIEATADHPVDDLLVDPIRLAVKDLVAGVGFTVYGEMDNATANGLYETDWFLSNG